MNNYTVYLHRNKSNGKVYIGITNRPVEKRWANGKAYSHCRRFNNAIKKYGWDGFEHTIVKDSLCKEEALSLEQSLIEHYQSCDVNKGYNLTSGGEHYNHSDDTRRVMSQKRSAMKGKISRTARVAISEGLKGNTNRRRTVRQYDKFTGKMIAEFSTVSDAARSIGVGTSNIAVACKSPEKTSGGFLWRYADEGLAVVEACPYKKCKGKKVRKCDSNGQVIAIYDSIIEAAVSNNINQSNIVKACRGKLNAVGGYKWEYAANSV